MGDYGREFPKIGGVPYFGGPYNKDPTILGTILGSPIFGNSHMTVDVMTMISLPSLRKFVLSLSLLLVPLLL